MAPPTKTKKRKSTETLTQPATLSPGQPVPVQFHDDVPDFPRGGGSRLSRGEREEVEAEVDADFGVDKRKKKFKGSKGGVGVRKSNEDEFGSLFGEGVTGKLPRFANKITFKNISPGMKLWGVITEVNHKDLAVSLPGGLRGLVRANEAVESTLLHKNRTDAESQSLSSLFHVGQLVSCVVLHAEDDKKESGKRKVWLSLRLALLHKGYTLEAVQEGMVMSAYVKSIEDHGYILDFGVASFTGFVQQRSDKDASETKVVVGQLVQGVVKNVDKTRKVVYLTSDTSLVSKCVTKDLKGFSLDLLVPGMMVNARIQATLENGIMLSFLTYFTGTVDIFHLQNELHSSDWKKKYDKNMKVNARILFVDPSSRAVGLTMNPHLILNKAPPVPVKTGDIYDKAKIVRVDKQWGLLLAIPCGPDSIVDATPAYVAISDVADDEVPNLEKKFKEGSIVRARILGFRHMEGLATSVLKASAFEGAVFTHADVKPGMVVKAKVIDVKSIGATVQFASGVKALCPLQHMSEFDVQRPRKKFKVGAVLEFRVLGCKSKRITVTHKKTLVKSKLGILSSYADATEHFVTHGWITKIEIDKCMVQFYNGVKGIVPRSELGLEPGCDPSSRYHVGQVVKCRVTSSVRAAHHINLSFIISPPKISEADMVKLGSIVSAVVEFVTPNAILLHVNVKGSMKGTIYTEHLSDHQEQAAQLKSLLKPGHVLSELLVLDIEGNNLILSAKYSLIHAIPQLPADITQISLNSVIHGYVCNLIENGCFVRFLGRLTGFSPRTKALDDRNVDISEAFYVGQSVRSNIVDIDSVNERILLSLKQSCCSSTDISFLQSYFSTESMIAELQVSDIDSELHWLQAFNIGSIVEGKVNEAKDVGVVVSFDKYTDVFGFITQHQLGGKTPEIGSTVKAVVLDVAKSERLVDLSLKPDFLVTLVGKKKRKREVKGMKLHTRVSAVVEIVKEDYMVVSLPEYNFAIGFASGTDYNTQKLKQKRYTSGETIVVNIMALPSDSTGNRMLLRLESSSLSSSSKKAKTKGGCNVGSLVQAEITDIKPLELRVKFGNGLRGRVFITETNDDNDVEEPFSSYKVGQTLSAKIVGKCPTPGGYKNASLWELSLKSSVLSGSGDLKLEIANDFSFSVGQNVSGYVMKVDKEWALVAISRHVKGRLFVLDSACEPEDLKQFPKRFKVGTLVSGYVLTTDSERKTLRLITRPFSANPNGCADETNKRSDPADDKGVSHFYDGDVVGGRVGKILPGVGGLLVQLGPRVYGKAHYTELVDTWISDPLAGYHEGQFVKSKILKISHSEQGNVYVDLSLRSSFADSSNDLSVHRFEKVEDLQADMVVNGYVKSVTPKGCFILLSRNIDAKILLGNLSDGYVKDPAKEFPVGKLVTGKVLSVEPLSKRVEVTLKLGSNNSLKSELSNLKAGVVIKGRIKRVESFGLFIMIDNTKLTGLCHVSEISDDHIDNLEDKFRAGDRVIAKVLKLDTERQRISLGMKPSYLMDEDTAISSSSLTSDEGLSDIELVDDSVSQFTSDVPPIALGSNFEDENELALAQVESRACVPSLEVILDDVEDDGAGELLDSKENPAAGVVNEKNNRRAKKKAKEEKELEIQAAEQRLLEKDAPKTTDEFEKMVRSSPNNSFVWIKYMQFMLSMADVEGARSVAERALKTINITFETEKLNVWVAFLNLENQYADPREEAVSTLFQRALQYCDPLKLHLELLGLYERTEQHKLADELLGKMVKKFKQSYEVWLRQIQWLQKQKPDDVDNMIKRALLSLPQHEHIKFLSQAAILEFKNGNPERGRSTFEKMLREYPKRTDLWSVYLDQEIRLGDTDLIRGLFERATSLSLPPKKMNFLFKKYLSYEKSHGDEDTIEHVRQKAKEYADTAAP